MSHQNNKDSGADYLKAQYPKLKLDFVDNGLSSKPFLRLRHGRYIITYADKSKSDVFEYDSIIRPATDASVIIAHTIVNIVENDQLKKVRAVYLRSCVRPALFHIKPPNPYLWECAAGLVDDGETPQEAAKRECLEELGFDSPVESFEQLGSFSYPTPGMCGERIHFFAIEVDAAKQRKPLMDGSPLEKDGNVIILPITTVIELIDAGKINDGKTEMAILRLTRKYSFNYDKPE